MMRLKNTTDYPDYVLRRVITWICRKYDSSTRILSEVVVRNKRKGRFSGRSWPWSGRIVCSVGTCRRTVNPNKRSTYIMRRPLASERFEWLLHILAHEIFHVVAHDQGVRTRQGCHGGSSERHTNAEAADILDKYRKDFDRLLSEWWEPPAEKLKRHKPSIQEQRSAAAQKKLAEWQRKLKLAQTKIKKYRRKVWYYEKATALKTERQTE